MLPTPTKYFTIHMSDGGRGESVPTHRIIEARYITEALIIAHAGVPETDLPTLNVVWADIAEEATQAGVELPPVNDVIKRLHADHHAPTAERNGLNEIWPCINLVLEGPRSGVYYGPCNAHGALTPTPTWVAWASEDAYTVVARSPVEAMLAWVVVQDQYARGNHPANKSDNVTTWSPQDMLTYTTVVSDFSAPVDPDNGNREPV